MINPQGIEYGEVAKESLALGTLFNTAKAVDRVAKKDIEKGSTLNKDDLVNDGSVVVIVKLKESSLDKLKALAGEESISETASKLLKDRLAKEVLGGRSHRGS